MPKWHCTVLVIWYQPSIHILSNYLLTYSQHSPQSSQSLNRIAYHVTIFCRVQFAYHPYAPLRNHFYLLSPLILRSLYLADIATIP